MLTIMKKLHAVEVFPGVRCINVRWGRVIADGDTEITSDEVKAAYGQYDREQFLADMADEPTAVTYADLAGLEVRAEQPAA